LEKGLGAVQSWIRRTYKPLVIEAIRARNEMYVQYLLCTGWIFKRVSA
jgi:hypothetical protein